MYSFRLTFNCTTEADGESAAEAINGLLAVWRMNGQIGTNQWSITRTSLESGALAYVAYALTPDHDSLSTAYHNLYATNQLARLADRGLAQPEIAMLGVEIDSAEVCRCSHPASYVLYTTYLSMESSLRCGDCFLPVPLYRIPHTKGEEYNDLISWQSDYRSCDSLQMNSATLERAATRELSKFDSSLSKRGIDICNSISQLTDKPTYYYLYRYGGRSRAQELKRLCPSCNNEWLLPTSWHLFDFKCDNCHLLSNIAWNVR